MGGRRSRTHRAGFTVVELLVAAVVFFIVTALAGSYLVQQMVHTQRTQARSEMQANLRSAMELITADLFNAGSTGVGAPCTWSGPSFAIDPDAPPYRHEITALRYCSPYGDGPVEMGYWLADDAGNGGMPTLFRGGQPAIPGIVALEFAVECAVGGCDPSDLSDEVLFVRVRILARSVQPVRRTTPAGFTFAGASPADLQQAGIVENGFFYEASERRVVLPNLGR